MSSKRTGKQIRSFAPGLLALREPGDEQRQLAPQANALDARTPPDDRSKCSKAYSKGKHCCGETDTYLLAHAQLLFSMGPEAMEAENRFLRL